MSSDKPSEKPAILESQQDFSLVLGGPLYQLFRRAHLAGGALEALKRRMLFITCVAWVPLLVLCACEGHVLGDAGGISFLHDIEAHIRFLVALPVMIVAELIVHRRLKPVVQNLVQRGVVIPEEVPRYHAAIAATMRWRNSVWLEIALIVVVYTVGLWVWRNQLAVESASWYATPDEGGTRLTLAGYWYAFVSVPFFQFILLRWYLRFFLWFSFLWRVSRLNLSLVPTHPDRAGGLGFLGKSVFAFGPVLFAQGAMLAGLIASQLFLAGKNLVDFKVQIAAFVLFFVIALLAPLTVFIGHLSRAKRQGMADSGALANRYAREFEQKWFRGGADPAEPLLGSADLQSLADLGNGLAVIQEMRVVPFGWKDATSLATVAVLPLLPLLLTVISLEELVNHLIKVVF